MDGRDMRCCSAAMNPCAPVYFMDKDKSIHEVFSFKYVRSPEIGPVNLLLEVESLVKDFGEIRLEQPPQELIDYMNQKWMEEKK